MRRALSMVAAVLAGLALAACGGGGGGGGGSSPSTSPTVTAPLTITTTSLPDAVRGASYSGSLTATGGSGPRTWSITSSGDLPPLDLNASTGQLSGTPSIAGTFDFTAHVTDATGTATRSLTLRIFQPLQIPLTALPTAFLQRPYSLQLSPEGGLSPYGWSLAGGSALPGGLTLSTAGMISGTPTAEGTFSFSVQVQDSATPAQLSVQPLTLSIVSPPLLEITTQSLPQGTAGELYDFQFLATGGVPPYTWSSLSPPFQLRMESDGRFHGTPCSSGFKSVTIYVTDGISTEGLSMSLTIVRGTLVVTTDLLPAAAVGIQYSSQLQACGGTSSVSWELESGTLPPGMTLQSSGALTGSPSAQGTFSFTVLARDSGQPPLVASRTLSIEVRESLGRNDSIASATPLSNGTHRASISPYADPPGLANPDRDFYRLTAAAGSTVTVETFARRLMSTNLLDTVIEIVDGNGQRFQTCRDPGDDNPGGFPIAPDPTPEAFDDSCMNDDIILGVINDSRLEFLVPGEEGSTVTFYVHVFDWSGHARPDMIYDLVISGVD
jgi:hypothetical protein